MPTKLDIHNARMLSLIAWAVAQELATSERAFLREMEFPPTNIANIRRGSQSFNISHIANACRLTGANANWILGLESNMMRTPGKTAMQQLLEAVVAVGQELGEKEKPEQNPEQKRARSTKHHKATAHK